MIQIFPSGPISTNAYVIACPETKQAVIIDPAPDSLSKIDELVQEQKLKVIAVWLTHSHWDHIGDAKAAKELYQVPLLCHAGDRANVEAPGSDHIPCWIQVAPTSVDRTINDGDTLSVGNLQFQVLHTPGHSPGGVCFYCKEQHLLISGDTLFQGSIGILALPGGDPTAMWSSLKQLSQLPPETRVFPGHGDPTTIGAESWLPQAQQIFGKS